MVDGFQQNECEEQMMVCAQEAEFVRRIPDKQDGTLGSPVGDRLMAWSTDYCNEVLSFRL